jgi:ribonucleoside-diphosphate reductase alpha chain
MATSVMPVPTTPKRYRLPETRQSITHKFDVDGVRCYATIGLYEDGSPGELFLKTDKQGSFEHGMVDAWAILFSMLLQHRIPLPAILAKFKHAKFAPRGVTNSQVKELRFADSILDYLVRWMEMKFLGTVSPSDAAPVNPVPSIDEQRCPHGKANKGNCDTCRGGK